MRASRISARIVAMALCVLLVPHAPAADDEHFEAGKKLFAEHKFVEAQQELAQVDREALTDEQREELDALLAELPQAIRAFERARQDLEDANAAYEKGKWAEADALYQRVLENKYASPEQRKQAELQRKRIAEKLELEKAARPQKPVEPSEPARSQPAPAAQEPAGQTQEHKAGKPSETPAPAPAGKGARPAARTVPPPVPSILEELRQHDELLWQRAVAKMQEASRKAREAAQRGDFDEARRQADLAVQVIEASRGYAQPPTRYAAARRQALDLQKWVQKAYEQWSIQEAARQREEILKAAREREQRLAEQRRIKVEQLFNTASRLATEQRFGEAAQAVREILAIDPANAKAQFYLDQYEQLASFYEQKQVSTEISRQMQNLLVETEKTRIPWTQDILYPKNWLEIVARREGLLRRLSGSDEDFELNRTLDETRTQVEFEDAALSDVLEQLSEAHGINVAVDWEDLSRHGIERDKPVTLKLHDVRLRTVLEQVLAQVGGDSPLGMAVKDGLLRIATRDKLDEEKYVQVYDIRDLLIKIPRFRNSPQMSGLRGRDLASPQNPIDSGALFRTTHPGSAEDPELLDAQLGEQDREMAARLMDIIRSTVEPDSWRETGTGDAALRELNGQLIVYQTSEAHEQIRDLLSQLRQSRALMIAVEGRFLIVSSNFLEEIGVDLDFVFNAGTAGFDPAFNNQQAALLDPFTGARILIPRPLSRAGVVPATPPFGGGPFGQIVPAQPFGNVGFVPAPGGVIPRSSDMTPIGVQQSSIDLVNPAQINTGIPGSFGSSPSFQPALNIAGSFLDNLQVDFLIRATQANRRSSIVQAPRLMLFNGQRAWVAVVRTRQYVSTVTANVAEGAVGVQPQPAAAQSGTTLDIEGTISADRKYVTLTVRADLAEEPSFEDFQVQRASGNSPGIFVRLPDQEFRSIRTTVSVPDGGTVLLGGLKQVGEVEVEAGVPILSKIPGLKRAFTNTTTVKDTQTLLILLKAKILIQSEAEEEAFPTLSSLGAGG